MKVFLREFERDNKEAFEALEKRWKAERLQNEVIPFSLNPQNLPFDEFFEQCEKLTKEESLPQGYVLAKYFLIWNELDQIVGTINLRYQDNDFILNFAGHVGYGIAPWERNKGYAKQALKQVLLIAKNLGLNKILLTADIDNLPSQHVISACGGVFEKQQNGKNFYWIALGDFCKEESAMALVVTDGKILTTRELVYGREILSLPKGHVEAGETHVQTAMRECLEETGVKLKPSDLKACLPPFEYQFVDHRLQFVTKTIYNVLFTPKQFASPVITEERILAVEYLPIELFLEKCSYENVREIVKNALTLL